MARVIAWPWRIGADGAVGTVEQWGPEHARQCAAMIAGTMMGERSLAPLLGVPDPIGRGLSRDQVVAALAIGEPDLAVVDVTVSPVSGGRQRIRVSARWKDDDEA